VPAQDVIAIRRQGNRRQNADDGNVIIISIKVKPLLLSVMFLLTRIE
jgi:hypothetical protein